MNLFIVYKGQEVRGFELTHKICVFFSFETNLVSWVLGVHQDDDIKIQRTLTNVLRYYLPIRFSGSQLEWNSGHEFVPYRLDQPLLIRNIILVLIK